MWFSLLYAAHGDETSREQDNSKHGHDGAVRCKEVLRDGRGSDEDRGVVEGVGEHRWPDGAGRESDGSEGHAEAEGGDEAVGREVQEREQRRRNEDRAGTSEARS